MYNASSAFHEAVAARAPQVALLIFPDAVFTNDDINVTSGIEFCDYFSTEEDQGIGQALSNELSFSLFNDAGLLDDYPFGDFQATLGAQIGNTAVTIPQYALLQAESLSHTYVAYGDEPYLKRDGNAVPTQPDSPIMSILIYNGNVYCRLENGEYIVYDDSTGNVNSSVTLNAFMVAQMAKWEGKGIRYGTETSGGNCILRVWERKELRTYEFVPLGWFSAERPNVPSVNELNFHCNDFMVKFDRDMPPESELRAAYLWKHTSGWTYPLNFYKIFRALCDWFNKKREDEHDTTSAEVRYSSTTFTINNTATISAWPEEFENASMREVMQWLAEAGASVARFNRDGVLIMDWMKTTSQVFDESGYIEFNPYWYQTKQVTKVYNRASDGSYDNSGGSGDQAYLIQDNPLLKGVKYIVS